jgi:hypothetical protein
MHRASYREQLKPSGNHIRLHALIMLLLLLGMTLLEISRHTIYQMG